MNSRDICIAIGVLKAVMDANYAPTGGDHTKQNLAWQTCGSAISTLTDALIEQALKEVNRV